MGRAARGHIGPSVATLAVDALGQTIEGPDDGLERAVALHGRRDEPPAGEAQYRDAEKRPPLSPETQSQVVDACEDGRGARALGYLPAYRIQNRFAHTDVNRFETNAHESRVSRFRAGPEVANTRWFLGDRRVVEQTTQRESDRFEPGGSSGRTPSRPEVTAASAVRFGGIAETTARRDQASPGKGEATTRRDPRSPRRESASARFDETSSRFTKRSPRHREATAGSDLRLPRIELASARSDETSSRIAERSCWCGERGGSEHRDVAKEGRDIVSDCRDARSKCAAVAAEERDVVSERQGDSGSLQGIASEDVDVVSEERASVEALRDGWLGMPRRRLGTPTRRREEARRSLGEARRRQLKPSRAVVEASRRLGSSERRLVASRRCRRSSCGVPVEASGRLDAPRGSLGKTGRSLATPREHLGAPGRTRGACVGTRCEHRCDGRPEPAETRQPKGGCLAPVRAPQRREGSG